MLDVLRDTYCGTIGVEYMFIADPERKEWLQQRMEGSRNRTAFDKASRRRILEKLVAAESFERFLHARYIGHKRFSLEGCEALIPLLDRVLSDAARMGMREVVIGMSHRGPPERARQHRGQAARPRSSPSSRADSDPESTQGSGDVKYHLGATGTHHADTGETLAVCVAPNPSHLEFVNPVVEGMVRAKQDAATGSRAQPGAADPDPRRRGLRGPGHRGRDAEPAGSRGLLDRRHHPRRREQPDRLHDAAPRTRARSTYCTDVAKMVQAPVFHVQRRRPGGGGPRGHGWPSSTATASSATWSSTSWATGAGATTRATSPPTRSR